jgi:hypothetical protein
MSSSSENSSKLSAAPVATVQPPKVESKSEAIYLKEQAANAKAAMKQTLAEIARGVGDGVSVSKWTEEHPWTMLASAAVAGFVGASIAVPSKEQQALRQLAKLEKEIRKDRHERAEHLESNGNGKATTEKKAGLTGLVVAELMRAASGIVSTLIKTSAQAPQSHDGAVPSDTAGGNGHTVP